MCQISGVSRVIHYYLLRNSRGQYREDTLVRCNILTPDELVRRDLAKWWTKDGSLIRTVCRKRDVWISPEMTLRQTGAETAVTVKDDTMNVRKEDGCISSPYQSETVADQS